jgi:hypothetical protein
MNRMGLLRGALVAAVPAAVIPLTAWIWHDRLPGTLPMHWNIDGEVDRTAGLTMSLTVYLAVAGAIAVTALAMAVAASQWQVRRGVIVTSAAATAFAAGMWLTTAALSLDLADPAAVASSGWQLLAVLAGTAAWTGLAFVACGAAPPPPVAESGPPATLARLDLTDGQRAVWTETGSISRWAYLALLPAFGGTVVLAFVNPWAAGALLLGLLMLVLAFQARVTVDARGLTAAFGPWSWPRVRVPLDEIVAARPDTVRIAEWGGWGYRRSLDLIGRGLILRGGPAVRLDLSGDRYFLATVRDPQTVSALLNSLLDQSHQDR